MQLLVSKILELSSESFEELPTDYVDLADEHNGQGTWRDYTQLKDAASKGYSRSGRGITAPISPKAHTDKSLRKSSSNCC